MDHRCWRLPLPLSLLARGLSLLLPAALLASCGPGPEAQVEPPLPRRSSAGVEPAIKSAASPLAPLATPQQVVRAVDVGRRDPFAAVLTPRQIPSSAASQPSAIAGAPATPPPPLDPPRGLVFQGVLQGSRGREALVEFAPSEGGGEGVRTGSLRVGDSGTAQGDSLLPLGWRVRAIDVERGRLVLQQGQQSVSLEL